MTSTSLIHYISIIANCVEGLYWCRFMNHTKLTIHSSFDCYLVGCKFSSRPLAPYTLRLPSTKHLLSNSKERPRTHSHYLRFAHLARRWFRFKSKRGGHIGLSKPGLSADTCAQVVFPSLPIILSHLAVSHICTALTSQSTHISLLKHHHATFQ
jgi:hypothetical protein